MSHKRNQLEESEGKNNNQRLFNFTDQKKDGIKKEKEKNNNSLVDKK